MTQISFPAFLILWNKLQNQSTPSVHLKLASWMERRWLGGDKRLLVMAFRSCGKSTIVGLFCTWLLWRDPDLRILVLAADLALARKMVRNVKRIVEKHPLTRNLVPAKADQWGSERFTLNRPQELRDPSMLAKSITTNLTGTRADIIICDDVEVPKTCDTDGKREALRERLRELDYILTPQGTQIYIGTPHHWHTIYADKKRAGKDEVFLDGFERIVIPILNDAGKSAWPERFSEEDITRMSEKSGPGHFASQMMCRPVNMTDGRFSTEDIEIYDDEIVYSESGQQPVLHIGDVKLASALAWWDPAFGRKNGDKSVVAVLYMSEDGRFWLHHIQMLVSDPNGIQSELVQQCDKVVKIAEQYFLPIIEVEMNGIGQFVPGVLKRMLAEAKVGCTTLEVTSRKPKNTRINEAFEAPLANKALNVHRTALHNSFLREFEDWSPVKRNQQDDVLDAVAGAISLSPVKLARAFGGKKPGWMGNNKVRYARTVLD